MSRLLPGERIWGALAAAATWGFVVWDAGRMARLWP